MYHLKFGFFRLRLPQPAVPAVRAPAPAPLRVVPTHLPFRSRFRAAPVTAIRPACSISHAAHIRPTSENVVDDEEEQPEEKDGDNHYAGRHPHFLPRRRNYLAHLRAHIAQKPGKVSATCPAHFRRFLSARPAPAAWLTVLRLFQLLSSSPYFSPSAQLSSQLLALSSLCHICRLASR